MGAVQSSQLADARFRLEEVRRREPGLGYTEPEKAMLVFALVNEDLLASCREMARVLAALRGSKKITLTEEQHRALQEPYARACAAITNAGGQP